MGDKKMIQVWKITAAENTDYDFEFIRVTGDPDGKEAMDRAVELLEIQLDDVDLDVSDVIVRIGKEMIPEEDYPKE